MASKTATMTDDVGLDIPAEFFASAPSEETVADPETPPTTEALNGYKHREPRTIRGNHTAQVSNLGGIKAYRFKDVLDMAYANGFIGFAYAKTEVYPNAGPAGNEPLAVSTVCADFESLSLVLPDGMPVTTSHYGTGDASPSNCNKSVGKHFVRMAETRAKARALAHAMNLDAVTAEELAGDEEAPNGASTTTYNQRPSQPASNGGTFRKDISEADFPAPNSNNDSGFECENDARMIPGKTAYWSVKKYNKYLCYDCQQKLR